VNFKANEQNKKRKEDILLVKMDDQKKPRKKGTEGLTFDSATIADTNQIQLIE